MAHTSSARRASEPVAGVQWRSWGPNAFEEAANADRPVLLCLAAEWCESSRRMDRTTYADPEIVDLIHGDLVPIRVDGDRLPHVQDRYIAGGWPTTAFLTATGEVLWAGTYVSPDAFRTVASGVLAAWRERREELQREIDRRRKALEAARSRHSSVGLVRREAADDVLTAAQEAFDARNGGFGTAPKFPQWDALEMLLLLGRRTRNPDWLEMAERTLDGILAGELWDARAGGFYRYAMAADWTEPRREKLVETNAAMLRIFALATKHKGRNDWRRVAEETAAWVQRVLGREDGLVAASVIAPVEPGEESEVSVDPVIYTNQNAYWIRALADAGGWLGRDDWVTEASSALDRLLEVMAAPDGLLYHYRAPGEQPAVPGLLTDLVAAAAACISVAQAAGSNRHIEHARRLVQAMETHLWTTGGGFLDHVPGPEDVGALRYPDRPFEANAAAARVLLDLYQATGERGYRAVAERTLALLSPLAGRYGIGGSLFALAVEEFFEPPLQVVVVGNDAVATALRRAALALPVPGGRVWTLERGGRTGRGEFTLRGESAAYVCSAGSCSRPVSVATELGAVAAAAGG